MGKKLAYTVHVRETELVDSKRPELGTNTLREETFAAGTELPDWAIAHVGDHVWELADDVPGPVAENGKSDFRLPPEKPGFEARDPETEKPASEAKPAAAKK